MKPLPIGLTIVLIILGLISGCTTTETGSGSQTSGASTLVCEVYYRPNAGQSLEAAQPMVFTQGNEQKTHDFENMNFEARFQDDQFEGRALSIAVTNRDTGDDISRQLYQIDPQNPVENQFIGGHGFTGLNYVFHPDSSAEMQYFCLITSNE